MTEPTLQTVPVQLHQTNQVLVLAAPLPGLEPQDITVHIEGHTVRIAGAERGSRQGQPEILVSEWTIRPYYREIHLPQPVNGTLTNATYGNGVLMLAIPLLEGGSQEGTTAFRLEATTSATGQRVGHTGFRPPVEHCTLGLGNRAGRRYRAYGRAPTSAVSSPYARQGWQGVGWSPRRGRPDGVLQRAALILRGPLSD